MARNYNTDKDGGSWSDSIKFEVWNKGKIISGYPSNLFRSDKCSMIMKFSELGNRNSEYGWEIDHIDPVANGGSDNISNLQPLNWKNNADKGDKLNWTCP